MTKKPGRPSKNQNNSQLNNEQINNEQTSIQEKKQEIKQATVKKQRDLHELVSVKSIVKGQLTYVDQMGYRVDWSEYGDENWIEYKDLVNMRNSQKKFFTEPWIICDWDVLTDLNVDKNYKTIIDLDEIDSVFEKSVEDLKKTLDIVPSGIKKLIADRAFELRKEKKLDSLSMIETIEKTLNIDLSI